MILYALSCDKGHAFESWFKDSGAYDAQAARNLVTCPHCGSAKVEKAIMAPQVARSDREATRPAPDAAPVALISPEQAEMRAKLRDLRDMLVKNSDYVGDRFPDEARKIHFGETDKRAIHGEASAEDVRSLIDDGVEIHPLPILRDDRN